MKRYIYDALKEYSRAHNTPWHMPGHKGRTPEGFSLSIGMDVTEIPGMDDYHKPEGIIRDAYAQLRELYGSKDSYFLVNGSTVGILAALQAVCPIGSHILMSRNCHRSVYHGVELFGLQAHYFEPEWLASWDVYGGISPEAVSGTLKSNPNIRAVVITSPTYEGIVSDIAAIAEVVHAAGAVLIVDEAHGAHFPFFSASLVQGQIPESSMYLGADIVIQSLHKTLPALTQTAILHRMSDRVRQDSLFHALSMLQSSSPSYLLMGSMDYATVYMAEAEAEKERYVRHIRALREKLGTLTNIRLFTEAQLLTHGEAYDCGKLLLSVKGTDYTGARLADALAGCGHTVEMYGCSYALCMTSVMDSAEDFDRLYESLVGIDAKVTKQGEAADIIVKNCIPDSALSIGEAVGCAHRLVPLDEAAGCISGDYIYAYPPGIPIVTPGEVFGEQQVLAVKNSVRAGLSMCGIDETLQVKIVIW